MKSGTPGPVDKEALIDGTKGKSFEDRVDVEQWLPSQMLFMVALVIGYIGAIMPVSISAPLIPSLEDDKDLKWSKTTSGFLLFWATILHSIGNIMLGHLSDVFGGQRALVSYMVGAVIMLVGFAMIQIVPVMVFFNALVSWLKGLAWPSVAFLIGDNLPAWRWDIAFLIVGCASRFGTSLCSMFIGSLLNALTWEMAVLTTCSVVMLATVIFCGLMDVKNTQYASSSTSSSAPSDSEPADQALDVHGAFGKLLQGMQDVPRKLKYLTEKLDFWLIAMLSISLHGTWIFAEYIAAFAHTLFGATEAAAAQVQSVYSIGQLAGLICGFFMVTLMGPKHGRRVLYVSALITLFVSIFVPVLFVTTQMPLSGYAALCWALGFLTVQVIYVPVGVFANLEGGPAESAALVIGTLDGISTLLGSGLAVISSQWREKSEKDAFFKINLVVGFCLCWAFCVFGTYVYRNWHGPVFDPVEVGDDTESVSSVKSHSTKDTSKSSRFLIGGHGAVTGQKA